MSAGRAGPIDLVNNENGGGAAARRPDLAGEGRPQRRRSSGGRARGRRWSGCRTSELRVEVLAQRRVALRGAARAGRPSFAQPQPGVGSAAGCVTPTRRLCAASAPRHQLRAAAM